jgi:hypothetical protein
VSSGVADVRLENLVRQAAGDLGVNLSGEMRSAVLSAQAEAALGDTISFSAALARDAAGAASIEDIAVSSAVAGGLGSGEPWHAGEIAADLTAQLTDLGGLGDAVSGLA